MDGRAAASCAVQGEGVEGMRVMAMVAGAAEGTSPMGTAVSGPGGRYLIANLPAGSYSLTAAAGEGEAVRSLSRDTARFASMEMDSSTER